MNPFEQLGDACRKAASGMQTLTDLLNEVIYFAPYGKTDEVLEAKYTCTDAYISYLFSTN